MKPAITVLVCNSDENTLKEVLAGIEEEGVNFEVVADEEYDIGILAEKASKRSKLEVGIAIIEKKICVHVRNLPQGKYLFQIDLDKFARVTGCNAARYVKGTPFTQLV
jgi:hypothetical protein